ncbi:unnamed protein product [Symbiodinium natans]|uniref:Uncharacterized protein n=1 Tax=Symbiodinium natans TaxID=878477 RepID=A0A812MAC8_9DINO|nr:unnamed protein product [Symbiodinium natans]
MSDEDFTAATLFMLTSFALKLGRSSPGNDEEMQSLASSAAAQSDGEVPSSPVESTRIPVETWLRTNETDERSGDSATAGSGSDAFSEGIGRASAARDAV